MIRIVQGTTQAVRDSREQRLSAFPHQFVCNSWLERDFADAFILLRNQTPIGHALIGGAPGEPRTSLIEFDLAPEHTALAEQAFAALRAATAVHSILAQSNDPIPMALLRRHATAAELRSLLFEVQHPLPHDTIADPAIARFRPLRAAERRDVFTHHHEPVGDFAVELNDQIVATGGYLTHYNPPFVDLFMEVHEPFRRQGIGAFLIQQLIRECAARALASAARCRPDNTASRACLLRAGMTHHADLLFAPL